MNADEKRDELNGITERVIGCAYKVSNTLGCGFLEKVYENSMAHEERKNGLRVEQQYPVQVAFDGIVVGEFVADLLVEGTVVVAVKTVKELDDIHVAQCLNYLKATGLTVCMLINFGKSRGDIRRIVNNFRFNSVLSACIRVHPRLISFFAV